MKMLKKTLILASTLALGFTLAGCSKKNVLMNKEYIYKDYANAEKQVKTMDTIVELEVISYRRIGERYIWAITKNKETVIYDLLLKKELYKTNDRATTISGNIDYNIFTITFEDGSKTIIASNGQTLVNKGNFLFLSVGEISRTSSYKLDNYSETKFYIYSTDESLAEQTKYYSLVIPGVKNEKKKIVKDDDTANYTISEIAEADVKKYNMGDAYPVAGNYYYKSVSSSNVISFYNSGSKEIVFTLDINGTFTNYKVLISGDKALVQIARSCDEYATNYDVIVGSKYYVDTYKIDLKNKSMSKVTNFKYYIANASEEDLGNQTILFDTYEIIDKNAIIPITIVLDKDFNVVQTDQKYCYANYGYYDLKNGYYLAEGNDTIYICDKSGYIVKVFDGGYDFIPGTKLIAIDNYDRLSFIDYKGNYVTDDVYDTDGTYYVLPDGTIYYEDSKESKSHVISFENDTIKEVADVDYSYYYDTEVGYDEMEEKQRYYHYTSFYITGVQNDVDSDDTMDNMTISIFNFDGEKIGDIENITNYKLDYKTNGEYLFAISNPTEENTYTLTIYALDNE